MGDLEIIQNNEFLEFKIEKNNFPNKKKIVAKHLRL